DANQRGLELLLGRVLAQIPQLVPADRCHPLRTVLFPQLGTGPRRVKPNLLSEDRVLETSASFLRRGYQCRIVDGTERVIVALFVGDFDPIGLDALLVDVRIQEEVKRERSLVELFQPLDVFTGAAAQGFEQSNVDGTGREDRKSVV